MSVKLLLLSALLLASYVTVKAGDACPTPPQAPPLGSPSIKNIPIIDTDAETFLRFESIDGDVSGFGFASHCPTTLVSCHAPPQDNWVVSGNVLPATLSGVQINTIQAVLELSLNCTDSNCSNSFGLYINQNPDNHLNFSTYTEVAMPVMNGFTYSIFLTQDSFTIGLRDTGTCVTIERFEVYHSVCVTSFSQGATDIPFGGDLNITCVPNTVMSTVSTSCSVAGELTPANPCECQAGFSGADGTNCVACKIGMFKSDAGSDNCTLCPMFSDSLVSGSTECACVKGHLRSTPVDITTPCDQCVVGYFMSSEGQCLPCPTGSNSTGGAVSFCTCNMGLVTATQSDSTTSDSVPCDQCVAGSMTPSGTPPTTGEDCSGCQSTHYLDGGSCSRCPSKSFSSFPFAENCTCQEGYARPNGAIVSATEDCVVVLGFTVNAVNTFESNVAVTLRANASTSVSVTVSGGNDVVSVMSPIIFANSNEANLTLVIRENQMAFNSYSPVEISIQPMPSLYVTSGGGMEMFSTLSVNVIEDDVVTVGFTASSILFNETQGTGMVTVRRIGDIASPLSLMITQSVDDIIIINNPMVLFNPIPNQPNAMMQIPFTIIDDNSGASMVQSTMLQLELISPLAFRNDVLFGGSGLFDAITVRIQNDEPPPTLPPLELGAIIGISVGGVAVAILAFFILILVICICHLRSVKRQGFYTTYEDQSKEPPTMLRYSASLRSISSQTVVPVANVQGTVTKENEFYV